MSPITIIWSMVASACLTLAGIYLLVWFRNRTAWAYLFFSLAAVGTAAFAPCELWVMRAKTPAEFGMAMRWAHVPLLLWAVSIVWFVHFYLGAGRQWLAWAICGMRAVALLANFLTGQNLNYREITALRFIPFLGESVAVPETVINPWSLVGQLSGLVFLVYVVDASVTVWRRGDRRKALMVGGSIALFLLAATGEPTLVIWWKVPVPIVLSLPFMGLVAAMGYELSRDVIRASQLVRELQASEAGLRESEQRLSLAFDAADFGIWVRDLARQEIWASDRWRKLFGFTPSERLELDGILQRLHPDDREGVRQTMGRAVAGEGRYETEFRVMLPDGGTRWISAHGQVEFDGKGKPIRIRGASRDFTDGKRAEQEAQLLRQEIAHVGRVSMMGQLASALAHEINQPLGAILRNAEAAELFLQNASPDLGEIRAILADIREDDQRAGRVIERMRGLLRRHNLETRALEVRELVHDVADLVRVDALARQVKLDVDVPADLPPVRGDRVHLQQVLLNLILNGMDAVNGASPENRRVTVTARLDGTQTVQIDVSDSGHGIPADRLAHIFDPFFTTKPDGMGMGLPISRTIIEAHHGRLWAENNHGSGAAFRFTLPVEREGGA
jgi:two-component system, LuxR family, sensor kinase FixL